MKDVVLPPFSHALASPPDHPIIQSLVDLGHVRRAIELALRLGDPGAARRASCVLRRQWPDAIPPIVLLGQALLDSDDPSGALEQFHRALKLNPLDAVAWAGLAGALALRGQRGESLAALRRAALHDPLGSESLAPGVVEAPQPLGMGIIYLRRGHAALAVAELAAALDRSPQRDDLRMYYVEALRRCRDLGQARRHLAAFEPANQSSLPVLLLRAALDTTHDDVAAIRAHCARYDPDGQMTRQFFAPERPPWDLPPAPIVVWTADLEAISAYLALLPSVVSTQKSVLDSVKSTAASKYAQPVVGDRSRVPQPDLDVSSFVATTELLRQRLAAVSGIPGPLVPWSSSRNLNQVLLGCKAALVRRYGDAGFAAIDGRLRALAAALRQRGVPAYRCYLDDAASLQLDDQVALTPVPQEAPAIRDLVRTMAAALAEQSRELGTLLLIGGDEFIPFHRLTNPLPDGDEAILSDNPYASDDAGYLLPQRIVARLPDSAGPDPTLLLIALDHMLDYHHGGASYNGGVGGHKGAALLSIRRGAARRSHAPSIGYCARVWHENSRAVLDALERDVPLHCSPPLDADTFDDTVLAGCRLLYLNLHGAAGLPNWYGQGEGIGSGPASRLPVALRPDRLADRMIDGGILVSEACYGMDIAGRTVATSIPLRALAEGALACVGATASAYGSFCAPLAGADLLCQRLLAHLAGGAPIGAALHQARLEFAQMTYRRQGYLDDADTKTLTEFVLFGDPWAGVVPPSATRSEWTVSKLAAIERVPKPRPKAVLTEEQVPIDLVRKAREALRHILPGAMTVPLYITARPNPRRARKSEVEQEVVFSAQESRSTVDGYHLAQTAHITLSGGAVVKVVLTR